MDSAKGQGTLMRRRPVTGETKGLVAFAAILWLIVVVAAAAMAMGNPTAINAVIGCSIPGVAVTYWAWDFHRQDRRLTARRPSPRA